MHWKSTQSKELLQADDNITRRAARSQATVYGIIRKWRRGEGEEWGVGHLIDDHAAFPHVHAGLAGPFVCSHLETNHILSSLQLLIREVPYVLLGLLGPEIGWTLVAGLGLSLREEEHLQQQKTKAERDWCTYLDAKSPDADAHLCQVGYLLLMEGFCREAIGIRDAEFHHKLGEHRNTFSFPHDTHGLNLGRLERLIIPVDLPRVQSINESARDDQEWSVSRREAWVAMVTLTCRGGVHHGGVHGRGHGRHRLSHSRRGFHCILWWPGCRPSTSGPPQGHNLQQSARNTLWFNHNAIRIHDLCAVTRFSSLCPKEASWSPN